MRRHFAWRPHLDRDRLYNPFTLSDRMPHIDRVEISEPYGEEEPGDVEGAAPGTADTRLGDDSEPPVVR